jgi:adenosylhomocysteine nucleosidase
MKRTPAIIVALPREVNALVKGWQQHEVASHVWTWTNGTAVVSCAGMGAVRAAIAVEAALATLPVTDLISAGLAGACNPKLCPGTLLHPGLIIDSESEEQYGDSQSRNILVSRTTIATVAEKSRLSEMLHAEAVDMEAATVARIARNRGLEFRAIKAISDAADFEMEQLSHFATADGQFREAAFALYTAFRPATWSKAIALARSSNAALAALTRELRSTLDWFEKNG